MTSHEIRVGVMALTDSAPFVVAVQLGLFEAENLHVSLLQQPSWATLRDKLAYGELDAAHMLAPMAVALQAGLGGSPRKEVLAPLVLSQGGNAITLGRRLTAMIECLQPGESLGTAVRHARQSGEPVPVFATVFPFSMHTLQLRKWLRVNGIDPELDTRIEVIPPLRMAAALKAGAIDAFCVGEPYNTLAVNEGHGSIVATGNELWPGAPEKVLGCTRAWAESNPEALRGFVKALGEACRWLEGGSDHRRQAAEWLSASDHVNLPQALLEKALLALAEDNSRPFVQFDGRQAEPAQLGLFQALVIETHGLVGNVAPSAQEVTLGLRPFGF